MIVYKTSKQSNYTKIFNSILESKNLAFCDATSIRIDFELSTLLKIFSNFELINRDEISASNWV